MSRSAVNFPDEVKPPRCASSVRVPDSHPSQKAARETVLGTVPRH